MDAVKFIEERNRMCKLFSPGCEGCRIDEAKPAMIECVLWMTKNPEKTVEIVEQWSQEHPRKTRQSNLLEMFPTARLDCHGVLMVCPANIDVSNCADDGACANPTIGCDECRREFWMQEVE